MWIFGDERPCGYSISLPMTEKDKVKYLPPAHTPTQTERGIVRRVFIFETNAAVAAWLPWLRSH